MALTRKTDAREFIRQIKTAPHGIVFMDHNQVLLLSVLDNGEQTVYEAPDPLDMETAEECAAFLVEVYQVLSDRAVMEHVSYLG